MNSKKLALISLLSVNLFGGKGSAAFGGFLGGFFTGNLINNMFRPSRQVVIVEKSEPIQEKIIIQNQLPAISPSRTKKEIELQNLEADLLTKEKELLNREKELIKRERKLLEIEQNASAKKDNEKSKNFSCILNIAD